MTKVVHLTHSKDLRTGGVIEAVLRLSESMQSLGVDSSISDKARLEENVTHVIAHGLWQWPGAFAQKVFLAEKTPYLLFPHGMLDPWFKQTFPFKHIKKQAYWWWKQASILRNAKAVCFTTGEECNLARNTFFPYRCREAVTGLGVNDPPSGKEQQREAFYLSFPHLKNRKVLLYLGRMHPKKGLDNLIRSFIRHCSENETLVLAGPIDNPDGYLAGLLKDTSKFEDRIVWTGMLTGNLKWGALRTADALILPSHQENYGMVVAEALSVGTPVFLTEKVNLWREVLEAGAGLVAGDDEAGIDSLVGDWKKNSHAGMTNACMSCFEEKLHIRKCAERILNLLNAPTRGLQKSDG